jgi:hypothetical protein
MDSGSLNEETSEYQMTP